MKTSVEKRDQRSLFDVLNHDIQNYFHFFLPLAIIHTFAWMIKPFFIDDTRGPWELIWHRFLDIANAYNLADRYILYVYGTFLVTTFFYWLSAAIFMVMDYTQMPSFLMKYKIQPGKNTPPPTSKVLKVLMIVFFNQSMAVPLSMLNYGGWASRTNPDLRYVPGVEETFGMLFLSMICHDCIFYHGHKMLHHRKIYKYIHKWHHEWQAPIAAAAEYSHPLEHFINQVSVSMGFILVAGSLPTLWVWLLWIEFQVQNDHSGYHFPWMFSPEFHDYHHLK